MEDTNPVDKALQVAAHINRRDLRGLPDLMSGHPVFTDLAVGVHQGRETMRTAWRSYFDLSLDYMIHVLRVTLSVTDVILVGRTTGSQLDQPAHIEIHATMTWVATSAEQRLTNGGGYYDTKQKWVKRGALPSSEVTC